MIHRFSFVEKIILRFNVFPHPFVDAFLNIIAGRAMHVVVKMGIFDLLETKGDVSLEEIQQEVGGDTHGLYVLLDVLVGLRYVEKRHGNNMYALSRRGRKFFCRTSESATHAVTLFADTIFRDFQHLEDCVLSGKTVKNLESYDETDWSIFFGAMVELSRMQVKEAVRKIPFTKMHKKLLDLGGMHGLYAIESCRQMDGLRAEIVDMPAVQQMAEEFIRKEQMEGRVRFTAKNFLTEPLDDTYDVIFLFSVIHGFTPAVNKALVKKIYGHLASGGILVIMDQFTDYGNNSDLARLVSSALGLMLFARAGGRTYDTADVSLWLKESGIQKITSKKLRTPGFGLIIGKK